MLPTLETERLRLRQLSLADEPFILKMGKDPDVMRFITNGETKNAEESKADLKRWIGYGDNGKTGIWAAEVKATGAFLGWFCLKSLDDTDEIEIGYRFLKEHWGNGYATEGAKRLLQYGFEELKLERIVAVAIKENLASTRVMEKIGLSYEKEAFYYQIDVVYYAIDR